MNRCVLTRAMLTALLATGCGIIGPQTSGGNGSDVEARVQGRALDTSGAPVSGADVYLRSRGFLADNDSPADSFFSRDTVTGGDGEYVFRGVDPGAYWIEVNDRDLQARLFACSVVVADTLVEIPADTLRPMAVITGAAFASSGGAIVRIPGLQRIEQCDSSRPFFMRVPEGTYSLLIMEELQSRQMLTIAGITMRAACTTSVGSVNISAACAGYSCDSIAVREILDANYLDSTAVGSVSRRDADRITELRFDSLVVTTMPGAIGRLSELTKLRITRAFLSSLPEEIGYCKNLREVWLTHNRLDSVPKSLFFLPKLQVLALSFNPLDSIPAGIGNLGELRWLFLSRNRLTAIPAEIGKLVLLESLDLEYNLLTTLPPEIGNLKLLREFGLGMNYLDSLPEAILSLSNLEDFSIRNNELCRVSLPLEVWLDIRDPGWRATQRCGSIWPGMEKEAGR